MEPYGTLWISECHLSSESCLQFEKSFENISTIWPQEVARLLHDQQRRRFQNAQLDAAACTRGPAGVLSEFCRSSNGVLPGVLWRSDWQLDCREDVWPSCVTNSLTDYQYLGRLRMRLKAAKTKRERSLKQFEMILAQHLPCLMYKHCLLNSRQLFSISVNCSATIEHTNYRKQEHTIQEATPCSLSLSNYPISCQLPHKQSGCWLKIELRTVCRLWKRNCKIGNFLFLFFSNLEFFFCCFLPNLMPDLMTPRVAYGTGISSHWNFFCSKNALVWGWQKAVRLIRIAFFNTEGGG